MVENLVERVFWRREDIKHTVLKIASFYCNGLPHLGTKRWIDFEERIIHVAMGKADLKEVKLPGDAFALIFIPPWPTLIPRIRSNKVVWEEREPRVVFFDDTYLNLAPSFRHQIYAVNNAIAKEVSEVYRVAISRDPFAFIFPKNEYGRVAVERAVILGGH